MSVLTIDLGTTTGWCLHSSGAFISDSVNLKGDRFEGGGMRFVRFRGWLQEIHSKTKLQMVFYEEVRAHKGTTAAHIYGGLQAILCTFCEENGIPYSGVPVQHIKKFVTGKGNAGKDLVISSVRKHGFEPKDDNEADAIALMLLKLESPEVQALR